MRTLLPIVAIVAFACIAVSCGGGGESGKAVIGIEGGVATSDDGKLTLDIPAGALDEETEITIAAISVDELPEALREASGSGPAYRLEPDGLVFNEPVPVALELDRSELDDVPEDGVAAQLLLTLDADGEIETLGELVTEATLGEETVTVSGELSHFSFLSRTNGALTVQLEEVERKQPVGGSFVAEGVVVNLDLSRRVTLQNAKGTFQAFGKASTTGNATFNANRPLGYNLPIKKKQTFRCRDEAGIGSYSLIGEATEVFAGSGSPPILTPLRVVLDSVVECVAQTPTPTPSPTGGPATPTPVTTTFTDPTGDEVIIEGGSDPAADIRTVRIGPSASGTSVFVTFGSDPSQHITHFNFVVSILLGEQSGFISFESGSDLSTAPEGGSFAIDAEGVLMVFPGPVPSGARLLVDTIHRETAEGHTAIDSFMATVP